MKRDKKEIKLFYDNISKEYDAHMRKSNHYGAQTSIVDLLKENIKEPILDLACGPGFLVQEISKYFSDIYANDFSKSMIALAKEKIASTITNDDAQTLKSHKRKYGTIISCNLFYYLENRESAIERWKELLENNGKIMYIEEFPFIKPQSEYMNEHSKELMSLIRPISPENIEKIMRENNFLLEKKISTDIDAQHKLYGMVFSRGENE